MNLQYLATCNKHDNSVKFVNIKKRLEYLGSPMHKCYMCTFHKLQLLGDIAQTA